jgi:hypothetical protein
MIADGRSVCNAGGGFEGQMRPECRPDLTDSLVDDDHATAAWNPVTAPESRRAKMSTAPATGPPQYLGHAQGEPDGRAFKTPFDGNH